MTITLSLTVARPEHLVGRSNNFKLLTELMGLLDGVCVLDSVSMTGSTPYARGHIHLVVEFSRRDDPMDEPICDRNEAWDWAMAKLVRDFPWAIKSEALLSFEPDQPPLTAKEREADRNLGDRPFSG